MNTLNFIIFIQICVYDGSLSQNFFRVTNNLLILSIKYTMFL